MKRRGELRIVKREQVPRVAKSEVIAPPRIDPCIMDVLVDFVSHDLQEDTNTFEGLHDVYKRFSNDDPALINALSALCADGTISREDQVIFYVLVMSVEQLHLKDSGMRTLRDALVFQTFIHLPTVEKIQEMSLHEGIRAYLHGLFSKITKQHETAQPGEEDGALSNE